MNGFTERISTMNSLFSNESAAILSVFRLKVEFSIESSIVFFPVGSTIEFRSIDLDDHRPNQCNKSLLEICRQLKYDRRFSSEIKLFFKSFWQI